MIARIAVRDTVIGRAIPMSATCSQRRRRRAGGAKRAWWMAIGRHIASTTASSIGSMAVADGRLSWLRVSRSVKGVWALSPGIWMYRAAFSPVKNCVMASADIAVAPMTIRRSRTFSRSMLGMPSAATSMTPSHPSIRMRPRSAPLPSRDGNVRRLADMYVARTAQVSTTAATRIG